MAQYFEHILDRFDEESKLRIINILEIWATYPKWIDHPPFESCNHLKIIENLKSEHYLDGTSFYELLNVLNRNYNGDIVSCITDLRSDIFSLFLKKGNIVSKKPIYVGTTVSKQSFYTFVESHGYLASDVDRLIMKSPDKLLKHEKELILKESFKLVWLTWDENGKQNPFAFLDQLTSANVYTAFALDKYYEGQELISFCFRLDRAVADFLIYRPTWCDATFFDKFHPTDPTAETRWGLTFPDEAYSINDGYEYRRPEGVIEADKLTLEFLHTPINILPL